MRAPVRAPARHSWAPLHGARSPSASIDDGALLAQCTAATHSPIGCLTLSLRTHHRLGCPCLAFVALLTGVVASAGVARADAPPAQPESSRDIERAKLAVELGQRLFDQARYDSALAAFEAAHEAFPSPEFQYDIGLCHERLGHDAQAIAAFEAYLVAKPDASDRASVEHRIALLRRASAATNEVGIASASSTSPPSPMPALRTGDASAPVLDTHEDRPAQPLITGGAITLSLGLAIGIGGGVGFGLPATARAQELDDALAEDAPPDRRLTEAQARDLAREGDRLRALQLASIGVGVALAATGTGLLVGGKRRQRRARAEVAQTWISPAPTGVAIAGRF
jgi:hypothetical protein